MAVQVSSRGSIRLRHDVSDEEEDFASFSDEDVERDDPVAEGSEGSDMEGAVGGEEDVTDNDEPPSEEETTQRGEVLKDISFGTLAEAQERFAPQSRKRKLPTAFDAENETPKPGRDQDRYKPPPKISRQSKHAPMIQSSRQQVSRKRDVFEPSPAIKSRDPRFDPTVMSATLNKNTVSKANKNYAFLTDYQADEILELKKQIKKAGNDPNLQASLKRQVMSIEAKIRNAEARQREEKIVKEHNQKEKDAIRAGEKAKPYYMKPSDIKKKAEEERQAGMGKKARDKAEKRKVKRDKSKDAKSMPRFRRE